MKILNASEIDFSKFEKDYPEHSKVIPAYAYADMVDDYFHGAQANEGLTLPWSKTHGKVLFRPGETTVWAGASGTGKSMLTTQVMLHAIAQSEPVLIASMEMKPTATLARMTRQACGNAIPSSEFIQSFCDWTDKRLWLYTQQNTVDSKRILAVIRYCHEALFSGGTKVKIKHFVIDSLMKCGIGVDDYNKQKSFVDSLCAFGKDTGMHIHLIAHSRKGKSERDLPDKHDIKGASEITDQVDNVFMMWRNKDKEDAVQSGMAGPDTVDKPDALLICAKQRNGEWEGKIALWFDHASRQYVAKPGGRPIEFFRYTKANPEAVREAKLEREAIMQEAST